jgi:hypothetical protein
MKLRNTTNVETTTLRILIQAVINAVSASFTKSGRPGFEREGDEARIINRRNKILAQCDIWVRQRTEKRTTGRAWLDGTKLRITIFNDEPSHLLWILRHEVWHLFGVRHPHFPDAVMHESAPALDALVELYAGVLRRVVTSEGKLPLQPVRAALSPDEKQARRSDRKEQRVASLLERKARWESKEKRAKTALATIRRQLRYYEKQGLLVAAHKKR